MNTSSEEKKIYIHSQRERGTKEIIIVYTCSFVYSDIRFNHDGRFGMGREKSDRDNKLDIWMDICLFVDDISFDT